MTIDVELNVKSLDAAIQAIEKYKTDLLHNTGEYVDLLAKDIDNEARKELERHVWSGETLASLHTERGKDSEFTRKATVTVGGAAVWLEFGTGVVANNCGQGDYVHPLGELFVDGIGTYGKGHGADPKGWYWEDEFGDSHHTYGIPATMFLYKAHAHAYQNRLSIARRVFVR